MPSQGLTRSPLPYDAPSGYERFTRAEDAVLRDTAVDMQVMTDTGIRALLTIQLLARDIWRWSIIPEGCAPPPPTGFVTAPAFPPVRVELRKSSTGLLLTGGDLTLRVTCDPFSFAFVAADGKEVFRDNPADIDGLGRPFVLPMGIIRQPSTGGQVVFSFHVAPEEHFFGLGEKFTPVDKRGQRIVSWTQDAFGSTGERSHKNIPFLISTRGYGLLLDTGARITWEMATRSCQSATVIAETPALCGYLISGSTPADILVRYADLTGRAPVPPRWSFGLWVSSGGTYRDRASMEALVDGLEQHRIPADVVHVDPWWMKWRLYCDFQWDTTAFPDPEGFIRMLHSRGLKLCLWEHPYVSVESDLYITGSSEGYFLRRPDGSIYVIDYGLSMAPRPDGVVREATPENSWNARVAIIDLTHPAAVVWFQDLHRPLLQMGVDVFKTDFGEDIPVDAVFANGQTGREMHNLYPLLYNEAVAAVTQQEHGQGMVWGRASTAGSQRTPVCWSGDPAADFASLACTIRGGISIGFSGIPFWSNDIGGYRGMPDPELYVRWAQFGLVCSHSRMHGDSPREPWQFGDAALAIVRRYVTLRYQLFPYLYSCAFDAHRTGLPVLRGMPLAFPDDPNTYDKDFQFMLGPWILVAPVIDRTGMRSVYLPEGDWFDYWTGTLHRGPRTIRVNAPLTELPMFVRSGAMIPMMAPDNRIPIGVIDPLILDTYPGSGSVYILNEDEGETRFALNENLRGYSLEWSGPLRRALLFRVHTPQGEPRVGLGTLPGGTGAATTRTVNERTTEIEIPRARDGAVALTTLRE